MKINEIVETFDTEDFHLAVTLVTIGYQIKSIDKTNPRRAVFRFWKLDSISIDAESYFADLLMLNPKELLANTKHVKSRLVTGL